MATHSDAAFPEPSLRAAKDIAFGSIAGMVSKVFEHPFDLTKVRLQAQVLETSSTILRFNGPVDCLTKTWRNEGFRGLYRGLPAPIVGAMAENASLFLSYSELQNLIRKITRITSDQSLTIPQLALAGAGSGAITSFILTPIELIKCKMQVQMLTMPSGFAGSPQGPITLTLSVLRSTGIRGLWLGQTGTLIRETGGTAFWFGTKEAVAGLLVARRNGGRSSNEKQSLELWESALSGACAGAAFNISLFPADTVKSVMQTEGELRSRRLPLLPGQAEIPTFFKTFQAMWKAQGIRGLYAGMGVTIARSIPSSAMIFLIYDGLDKRFS